uniref:EARP complex and GARP complex interacting protein 1 n=1 Tax=Panthera tigris altaica TaxID=74533 RepID=A0A8C9MC77_PANTA
MEDDAPVIYGLEFQARALTPQTAETDAIRFLVGTQSLKYDNQIHIIDFDDENNIINKNVLLHQVGEIWHISASPADKGVLATCYNKPSDSKVLTCAAVWRMPKELEPGSHESPDDSSSPAHTLELLCHLDDTAHGSVLCEKRFTLLFFSSSLGTPPNSQLAGSASLEGKGQLKFTSGRWSPHHTCTQVATANDTTIRGWDTRSMRSVTGELASHGLYLTRRDPFREGPSAARPVSLPRRVWSVRYNHSHDQLVLTGSSDSRVILSNMVSISSEPFGHLVDRPPDEPAVTPSGKVRALLDPSPCLAGCGASATTTRTTSSCSRAAATAGSSCPTWCPSPPSPSATWWTTTT